MKLRQKLAVALASAMVVTSVPVVTMAASNNKIVKSTQVIKKDTISTDAALRIKFENADAKTNGQATEQEEFYLKLTNAEWLDVKDDEQLGCLEAMTRDAAITKVDVDGETWDFTITPAGTTENVTVTYTRQDDDVVKVNLTSYKDMQINLPLPIKAKSGEVSVAITTEGSGSTISTGSYAFATTGDKAGTVAVEGDVESFYDNGELTKIVVKENFVGSLTQNDTVLKVELNNTDFEFTNSTAKVKGTYGFASLGTIEVKVEVDSDDKSTAYIYIPQLTGMAKKSLGRLEITGLTVDNNEKDIEIGELTADVKAVKASDLSDSMRTEFGIAKTTELTELEKDFKNLVVANIVNYGAYIQMKDEKAVDIVAGRDEEIEFTVAEAIDDCFVSGRKMDITLDSEEYKDAFFWIEYKGANADYTSSLIKDSDDDDNSIIKKIEVEWDEDDQDEIDALIKAGKTVTGSYRATKLTVTLQDGKKSEASDKSKKLNANNIKDEFTITTNVYVPVDQKDKKELTLVASMRGVDEFKSATAVNVINPFNVTFDETTLKVGLQKQAAGKIVITETDKEMLSKGNIELNVTASNETFKGIAIEDEGKLTVSGDLKKADLEDAKGTMQIVELKRQSKAASTLTIEDMLLTVDRTVPEGTYDLEIGGTAIDLHGGTLKLEDYIVIGTPNTQDITAANGLARGTATFSANAGTYTINGVEKTMDAAVFIQDPGFTMVPVRYVAEAFGVADTDIMFGKGTVTIFAGNRTVQLTNGSDVAIVNGASVAMQTKVVIKDGRTYAPIGEIARILGVSSSWDNTTKTATFENK